MTCSKVCDLRDRLRETVIIKAAATPTNGDTTSTYANAYTGVRAEIIETSGTEGRRGDQAEAIGNWRVTIRYKSGIGPTHAFLWGTKWLYVVSAYDPDGMKRLLVCVCSEVQP